MAFSPEWHPLKCGPFERAIVAVDAVAIGWRCQSAKAAHSECSPAATIASAHKKTPAAVAGSRCF
jgi:hypothetical protein